MKKFYHSALVFWKFSLAIILTFFLTEYAFSQNLLSSKQTSHYSYIYKITDAEAEAIYRLGQDGLKDSFFHTLVDSFPVGTQYDSALPIGHYLKTRANRNKQEAEITSVQSLQIFTIKNDRDLNIQVLDKEGNIVTSASVWVDGKKLAFSPSAMSYQDKKSNKKGLVKVVYGESTSFFHLDRNLNNPGFKRTKNKVLYSTPIRYVWVPVRFVLFIPVDGYRSIKRHYPYGSIYKITDFSRRAYHNTACLFDDYHCDFYDYRRPRQSINGYMVFDKPKYKPLDTLRMKSYIVNKKGKPIKENGNLVLYEAYKEKLNKGITPIRDGAYTYQLVLNDSLGLKLDKEYTVKIESRKGKEWTSQSFRFEEYELGRNSLELSLSSEILVRGSEQLLSISAKDENDLRIKDGKVQVWVFPHQSAQFLDSVVFLPDTLLYVEREILPDRDTELAIPDSIFPLVNLDYTVKALLLNADFESTHGSVNGHFKNFPDPVSFELGIDSLSIQWTDGDERPGLVSIYGMDSFGNKELLAATKLPAKMLPIPIYTHFAAEWESVAQVFDLASEDPKLNVSTFRNRDEVVINIQNPRNIPVSYFLYRGNKQIQAGHQPGGPIKLPNRGEKNYFLSLNYLWAGKNTFQNYQISLDKYRLRIQAREPVLVYPGEEAEIQITVKDYKDRPVEGVDLTAFGLTKKFEYRAPTLPFLGKNIKGKKLINNFDILNGQSDTLSRPLNYPAWKILASLDTIPYYNFIYPESKLFRYEYGTADSITQFSPFLVSKGDFDPISVIYVDKVPVYFYWNTIQQPYAFPVSPGYRQIKFRLKDKVITLDSVYFEANKRTILSIDPAAYQGKMTIETVKPEFSQLEKNHLYHYIFPYRNPFTREVPYLLKGGSATYLGFGDGSQSKRTFLAGPIDGFLNFKVINGFTTRFEHEPYFEYDFREGLLKMRSANKDLYPTRASRTSIPLSLSDKVMTEEKIFELWQSHLEKIRIERAQYTNPRNTSKGRGRMQLGFDPKAPLDSLPINILVFNLSDINDIRVYPGSTRVFHDLSPGKYQLVLLFKGASYGKIDSIQVHKDGLNYLQVPNSIPYKKDGYSQQLVDLIEKTVFRSRPMDLNSERWEREEFQRSYMANNPYTGPGERVYGYILDDYAESLPGVTVVVKGTNIGTTTDLDGYYELIVPFGYTELLVSFVGFVPTTLEFSRGQANEFKLQPDVRQLSEVVVVGYGVEQSKRVTSAIAVVNDDSYDDSEAFAGVLQGHVAGVVVQKSGVAGGFTVQIRGTSSTSFEEKPLILVDGKVFLGDLKNLDLSQVKRVETLTGEEAVERFGEKGKNGAFLIFFQEENPIQQTQSYGLDWDSPGGGKIRSNFSDAAFWQPDLLTDAAGKASFKVKFPDDITAWQTHVLAMGGKRQVGQKQGLIKSYMPLAAQLFVPRFIVAGDTARVLGKSLNYLGDSLAVETGFEVNAKGNGTDWTGTLKDIRVDTLLVTAQDSLKIQYQLVSKSGFKDGEIRNVPIFPIGMAETKGHFAMLEKDTVFTLHVDTTAMNSTVTFWSDLSDLFEDELEYIHGYRYLCNEQMASKIKALLLQRDIDIWKNRDFKQEKMLRKLIADLQKNQRPDGLWGWWKDSDPSIWITLHVVEALKQANAKGFAAGFTTAALEESILRNWEKEREFETRVKMVQTFLALESQVGYSTLLQDFEKTKPESAIQKFNLLLIKSQLGDSVSLTDLEPFRRKSILGNTYYGLGHDESRWMNSDLRMSILAYQILRRIPDTPDSVLTSVRNYLFEKRSRGNWTNTYLSSLALQTLVPDMLKAADYNGNQTVVLAGAVDATVTKFPFIREIEGKETLKVRKTGNVPMYFSFSEKYWNTDPVAKKGAFEISTRFAGEQANVLQAGKAVDLIVELVVQEDASFVMINVPIPGGCSYGDKRPSSRVESHREYFLEETAIFCENLPKGKHTFKISLEPRFTGTYTLNPAKVELMYFPTINANEEMGRVRIVDRKSGS